jgi:opacity protein-like surface antigen
MKKTIIISALLIMLSSASFSQDNESAKNSQEFKTLLGNDHHNGFYGAFTIGYSEIEDKQAVTFGGRFEWIAGHSIGLGFGGSGFINENHFDAALNSDVFLTGGYGGLYIEPILMPNYPVHFSFPILLGAGGISYVTDNMDWDHNMIEDSEAFLIAEPGAELELNLTRIFRLAIGTSYRFTTPFDVGMKGSPTVTADALKGFTFMMTFKFGRF